MTYKTVPEYWSQPGEVTYHYVNSKTRAVVNIDSFDDDSVLLWAINAWGSTAQWRVSRETFDAEYERIDNPQSLYDAMREATA